MIAANRGRAGSVAVVAAPAAVAAVVMDRRPDTITPTSDAEGMLADTTEVLVDH